MEPIGVRQSVSVHPKLFVKTDSVHNQGFSFPAANRVAVVTGEQIFGMRTAVHVDDPKAMRTSDVHDEDTLEVWHVHNLDAVRRDEFSWSTGRFAARVRLVPQDISMAGVDERPCPGLERYGVDVDGRAQRRARLIAVRVDCQPTIALPQALFAGQSTQVHSPIGPMWRRRR